jgi:redox-sensitive bicupin YhaK (pirin superfamily)
LLSEVTGQDISFKLNAAVDDLIHSILWIKSQTHNPIDCVAKQYQLTMQSGAGKLKDIQNKKYNSFKTTGISEYLTNQLNSNKNKTAVWEYKMKNLKLSPIVKLQKSQMSKGFSAYDFRYTDFENISDPVISMTHFFMSQPTFPPHPHAGFSAITYMLEHSKNGFNNRDSLGNASPINPGDLHWTLAARGVMHEEVPQRNGVLAEGLQVFINLKEENKFISPTSFHVDSNKAPVFEEDGLRVKVLSGVYNDTKAIFQAPEPTNILDITLDGNSTINLGNNHSGMLYVVKGSFEFLNESKWQKVDENSAFAFRGAGASELKVRSEFGAKLILLSGFPTNEPIVARGPFIMTNIEALRDAEKRFELGDMGDLE